MEEEQRQNKEESDSLSGFEDQELDLGLTDL